MMLKYLLTEKLIGMLVRHILSAIGVWMVGQGIIDEASWQQVMGGGLAAITGLALSLAEKIKSGTAPPIRPG